jgi:hypothetical protein
MNGYVRAFAGVSGTGHLAFKSVHEMGWAIRAFDSMRITLAVALVDTIHLDLYIVLGRV